MAWHIKQVASDPQVAQINLMRHPPTDRPPTKQKQEKSFQVQTIQLQVVYKSAMTCGTIKKKV